MASFNPFSKAAMFAGVFMAALVVMSPADASAQQVSRREAQSRVDAASTATDALVARFPALQAVKAEIVSDCEGKADERLKGGEFCQCAAAVTMQLWMSGIDPNMVPRLQAFVDNPAGTSASSFLAYQGPELYAPLCARAAGGR